MVSSSLCIIWEISQWIVSRQIKGITVEVINSINKNPFNKSFEALGALCAEDSKGELSRKLSGCIVHVTQNDQWIPVKLPL